MRGRSPRGDDGFTTIQYVAATGLSLVMFVLVANLLVDLYARGAIRDALDEAAHAVAPVDASPDACEARAAEVLDGLLRGPIGDDVEVRCEVGRDWVVARADVTLPSWLPLAVPDWSFTVRAVASREEV